MDSISGFSVDRNFKLFPKNLPICSFCRVYIKYWGENASWEAEIHGTMLLDMLLTGIGKAGNPRAPFFLIGTDCLPKSEYLV